MEGESKLQEWWGVKMAREGLAVSRLVWEQKSRAIIKGDEQ